MINKKSIWFLTLFSLILVLSVYYVTMPSELLLTNNSSYVGKTEENTETTESTSEDTKKIASLTVAGTSYDIEKYEKDN